MGNDRNKLWNILWAVLAVGAFYLVSNLLTIVGYVAIPRWLIQVKPEQASSYMLIVDIVISIILLGLSFLVYKKIQRKSMMAKTSASGKIIIICLIVGIAIFGVNTLLDMILKPTTGAGAKESLMSMIITGVIFAPLIEELFFRGIVYNLLNRFRGGWIPVVFSALIFGIYHVDFYQIIYTTILGIVLALVYQKTENILYPIIVHMSNNVLACLIGSGISEISQKVICAGAMLMIIPAAVFFIKNKNNRELESSSDDKL